MNSPQTSASCECRDLDLDLDLDVRTVIWDVTESDSTDVYTISCTCYGTICRSCDHTCIEQHTCYHC